MAITTYAELKSSIANWLNRDDLTAVIPDFIALAEADINRNVRHWRQEKRATATIDSRYSSLVGDYLEAIRFHLDVDERPLSLISSFDMQQRRMNSGDTSGRPSSYCITGGQIEVYPTPDAGYTGELYYVSRTEALSDSNPSNWLLQYYPDVYLYGALIQSAPYLSEDQRAQTWAALYQSAISGIDAESQRAKFSGSGRRLQIRSY
jgi:hypothetical protein